MVLYPSGCASNQIGVHSQVKLPDEWQIARALEVEHQDGSITDFAIAPLDRLVDSPLFAGRNYRRYELERDVTLNVFADRPAQAEVSAGRWATSKIW